MGNKVQSGKVGKSKPSKSKPSKSIPVPSSNKLSEIDDIFATKAPEPVLPSETAPISKSIPQPKNVKVIDATAAGKAIQKQQQLKPPKDDDFADSRGKNTKYTDDGLRVFFLDDLRIGEGEGDTEQCPFDCDCCY
ncbi:hypothetical protein IWW56_001574 [Coemansia sp. RSA 2131]|nr:hypothetical protein IWW56_001574 [Coemansia sp. RSA 2131]